MTFLLLTILCSSAIGLTFKYSEKNNMHRYAITTASYLTASVIGLILSLKNGLIVPEAVLSLESFLAEFYQVVSQNSGMLSPANSWIWAVIIGMITGVIFLFALIFYQKSIAENGIALSAMSSRLGVLIPMSVSIVLWNEIPDNIQIIGIALAIGSIVLVNLDTANTETTRFRFSLIMLFLLAGIGIFCNKLFQKYGLLNYRNLFLFTVFFTALLISLYLLRQRREKGNYKDLIAGVMVGTFNLLTNYFMILALAELKASVVFPISSAGTIITMTLGGWVIFRERLNRREIAAIGMTLIALVLINI